MDDNPATDRRAPSKERPKITVLIPALNEEQAIGSVLDELPKDLVNMPVPEIEKILQDA